MKLAVFDMDHTLMPMDTGDAWVRFVTEKSGIDSGFVHSELARFAREYRDGTLSIDDFESFQMRFIAQFARRDLDKWLAEYIETWSKPNVPVKSRLLVEKHVGMGDHVALCSATYDYVVTPVAALFGIDNVLCVGAGVREDGEFSGEIADFPSYMEGKIAHVERFLERQKAAGIVYESLVFYSDSDADMPLFEYVERNAGKCVAVNPNPKLLAVARERGWEITHTYDGQALEAASRPLKK